MASENAPRGYHRPLSLLGGWLGASFIVTQLGRFLSLRDKGRECKANNGDFSIISGIIGRPSLRSQCIT